MLLRTTVLLAMLGSVLVAAARAQDIRPPLEFLSSKTFPNAILTATYEAKLEVTGGFPPWTFDVIDGEFPPGLNLDPASGTISGIPTALGQYHFAIEVRDSDDPPESRTRDFTITVISALTVEWKNVPAVTEDRIQGSVKLANQTSDDADLTLIVVAVNETGKAWVLGYQHFVFNKQSQMDEIPFGSSLPRGDYIVHVDAIAEVPAKNAIYRARLQTRDPLTTH